MGRNILIFSDGTGQAGGLVPDEVRSNVYKLYRATRCGPDSTIDPSNQIAFYDPGIGTTADSSAHIRFKWLRPIYNFFGSAMGLGITSNIIDCYVALLSLWRPGDQIFLFGFSRGAYTVRCLGGVLSLCGIPTKMANGDPLNRDPPILKKIATEAVKDVYQYKGSIEGNPFKNERKDKGVQFRTKYASSDPILADNANAIPYFIGVWDTVAAIGAPPKVQIALYAGIVLGIIGLAALLAWIPAAFGLTSFWIPFIALLVGVAGTALVYVKRHWLSPSRQAVLLATMEDDVQRYQPRSIRQLCHARTFDR